MTAIEVKSLRREFAARSGLFGPQKRVVAVDDGSPTSTARRARG